MENNRAFFAKTFCLGQGIEIGALHHPMRLPPESRVRYLDRLPKAELLRHYSDLPAEKMVEVDILDSGETLAAIPDGSEDFVIAAQFIEHCENPIRAVVNMLRVVKAGGFVFLTVPDKRFTFDKDRPLTSNEHLLEECMRGTEGTRREHFREWARFVEGKSDPIAIETRVDYLLSTDYSIHFHVWDGDHFLRFLMFIKEKFRLPLEIFGSMRNGNELMVAIQKLPA